MSAGDRSPRLLLSPTAWIVLAVLPFWALPIAHLASSPETATGFFHYELPYYMANGRAAFDRGNGFLYPNPYDPAPDAPVIYGHWLLWSLGVLPALTDADPGDLMLGITFAASLIFSMISWRLVAIRLPPRSQTGGWFLLAMWGGGILSVGGWLAGLLGLTDPVSTVLQFDPGKGLWFLNWGRNATFPTEAIYHILTAACWICEMRAKRVAGTIVAALLASTHPWSGLELLLTLNLWRCLCLWQSPDRRGWILTIVAATLLGVFLGYYQVWLPAFESHQKLQRVWQLDWSLSWTSAALAYILVFVPAALRCSRALRRSADNNTSSLPVQVALQHPDPVSDILSLVPPKTQGPLDRAEQFLLCALLTAVGLAFHDRIIHPVQPLHFTRGYLWMPMFLLGLPTLHHWAQIARRQAQNAQPQSINLLAIYCVLLIVDNLSFAAIHGQWLLSAKFGFHLDPHERALLTTAGQRFPDQVWLSESDTLNYLAPAFADVRPWLGHQFNTPDFPERHAVMDTVFQNDSVQTDLIPGEVDVLAVRSSRNTDSLQSSPHWTTVASDNAEWNFWSRVRSTSVPETPQD